MNELPSSARLQTQQWSECRIRAEWRVTVRIHHSVSGHEEQDVLRSTWRGLQRTFDVFDCRGINRSRLLLWLFEAPASSHRCFHVVYLMTHRLWTPSYSSFTSQSKTADRCRNLLTWKHVWEGSLDIFTPNINTNNQFPVRSAPKISEFFSVCTFKGDISYLLFVSFPSVCC